MLSQALQPFSFHKYTVQTSHNNQGDESVELPSLRNVLVYYLEPFQDLHVQMLIQSYLQKEIYGKYRPVEMVYDGHEDPAKYQINIWFHCVKKKLVGGRSSFLRDVKLIGTRLVITRKGRLDSLALLSLVSRSSLSW